MKYKAKSALIGRSGKRDDNGNGPVYIHLFNQNDPHKSAAVPDKFVDEHTKIHKIMFKGLNVNFLLAGSDILINDLEYIEVDEDPKKKGNLIISGKQK
jgi:hypothetical protein